MVLNLYGVVIIEFEYQECHIVDVIAVERLNEFAADTGQYEITEIGMRAFKIVYQGRERYAVSRIVLSRNQIGYGQKSGAVYIVFTTYLGYGAVT